MIKPTDTIKFILPGPVPKTREGKVIALIEPFQIPDENVMKKSRTHRIMFVHYPGMRSTRNQVSYMVEVQGQRKPQLWWVNKENIL